MLDFAEPGQIRPTTDVFPQEPLSPAHQAGALDAAINHIGKMVVAGAELIACGLPPILCKRGANQHSLRPCRCFAASRVRGTYLVS